VEFFEIVGDVFPFQKEFFEVIEVFEGIEESVDQEFLNLSYEVDFFMSEICIVDRGDETANMSAHRTMAFIFDQFNNFIKFEV
jgi:hypothetical protein